ncbi:hypothetical protein [Azospirillum sp. sgz302134]
MTGMMLYFSLGLMVLTVISNRYWRRQLHATRASQDKVKELVEEVTKEVAEVATVYAKLAHQHAEMEKRVAKAEQEMQAALLELDKKRESPVTRYHVFDRVEPRQGRFWEAAVRYVPADAAVSERQNHRSWTGLRRFVLVAETEREVRDRIAARYPRKAGFHLLEAVHCRLNGLAVNRIAELSTFRKPSPAEDDDKPPRRRAAARN